MVQPGDPTFVGPLLPSETPARNYLADASKNSYGGDVPALGSDRSAYSQEFFVNPPLRSPETAQYPGKISPRLYRGWLMESPYGAVNPVPDYKRLFRLNFHFNPSEVTMNWNVQTPDYAPFNQQDVTDLTSTQFTTLGVEFGFNILLDRVGDTHPATKYWGGVNADIRILNAIMTSGASQPGQNTFATPSPVFVALGRRYDLSLNSSQNTKRNKSFGGPPKAYPLGVTGFMSACNVDYQRFDADMTPTRAVVSVAIQVLTWNPDSLFQGFSPQAQQPGSWNATRKFPTSRSVSPGKRNPSNGSTGPF